MCSFLRYLRQKNSRFNLFFLKINLFLERGEGRERGRETAMCGCYSRAPYWGPEPCVLTGNLTSDPLVLRPALNPLSHTSQGLDLILNEVNGYCSALSGKDTAGLVVVAQ